MGSEALTPTQHQFPPTGRNTLHLQQGGLFCSPAKEDISPHTHSANEKPPHFGRPVSSNGLSVYNRPSARPLSAIKEPASLLLSGPVGGCEWFAIRLYVPNYNSLLSLNKPSLLEKCLAVCLF